LLWGKDYGQGRFVVFNTDQLANQANRGIIGAAYGELLDVFVYPVINSSVFFIDDFPAPLPQGENEYITRDYHRSIKSFYMDVWWPDMREIAQQHGTKYTGLLVETYNATIQPPFGQDNSIDDQRYFGRLLLKSGGDIGLHGYNHVPLCRAKDGLNQQYGYVSWASVDNEMLAVRALADFGHALFPGQVFHVYVPPSNVLCPEARIWLPRVLPEIKVISSLWKGVDDVIAYTQNFEEAPDGIIEFPRVVSGYYLGEDMQLALINELGLHYVNSHYLHPDDVQDEARRAGRDWKTMRDQFADHLKWLTERTPGLRNVTAAEGAMAVQRFSRLQINAAMEGQSYAIHLGSFYDQAYLMLRSMREPLSISGGKLTQVTSSLYLVEANEPDITIEFRKWAP
jgi:hypothetical protein